MKKFAQASCLLIVACLLAPATLADRADEARIRIIESGVFHAHGLPLKTN